ncbi:hypothetical protein EVAR_85136_1 [Eumeta japonica]|uniref:Uncharacterized protein n=1 Tax=Eumeta variegata TaxID=151549 RepID=A0A4C1XQT8_EUMVA|nr:hypothetical protein EVAR_85136_1 [Eumeta japonica]
MRQGRMNEKKKTVLYASCAWAPATGNLGVRKMLDAVQRCVALKACRAHRTVALHSALILSRIGLRCRPPTRADVLSVTKAFYYVHFAYFACAVLCCERPNAPKSVPVPFPLAPAKRLSAAQWACAVCVVHAHFRVIALVGLVKVGCSAAVFAASSAVGVACAVGRDVTGARRPLSAAAVATNDKS